MSGTQVITEKDIEKNVVVNEKDKKIEVVLKDLEDSYKKGLISKEAYEKARTSLLIKKEAEIKENISKVSETKPKKVQKEVSSEKKEISKKAEETKEIKKEDNESVKNISFIKRKHIEELKKMKENWVKDLESLRGLYEHGVISEEEYERSKIDIEEKIGKIEEIIKKELEVEELEDLKERIEREIRDAFNRGVFKEEESKLKRDLEALDSLFRRGLISEDDYQKKRKYIESQLENYSKLIDLIDAIFNRFIEEINKKIEENKEATKQKENEAPKESVEEKKPKKYPWYAKVLHVLGLYEIKESKDENKSKLVEEVKKAYMESETRFKISNMALIIKKKIKEIMNIDKAMTYKELIDNIESYDKFDENIKAKLRSYFQAVMLKEYLEEEDEKDIENIYKESLEIAKLLENFKEEKKENPKKAKEERKEIKKIEEKTSKEKKEEVTKEERKEKNKEKKSIFDKINEFFGV